MKLKVALNEVAAKTGVSWIVIGMLVMSMATNVLQALHTASATTTHRETFVPPTATRPFWVEDTKVSREYTQYMGMWALDRLLNVSGYTASDSGELLLPWVHPRAVGNVQSYIAATATRLKEAQASTTWLPQDWTPFEDRNAVVIRGLVTTYVGDRATSRVVRAFWVRLERSASTWYLSEIREVDAGKVEGAAIAIDEQDAKKKAEKKAAEDVK